MTSVLRNSDHNTIRGARTQNSARESVKNGRIVVSQFPGEVKSGHHNNPIRILLFLHFSHARHTQNLEILETFAVDRSTALTKENEKLKQELKQVKEE